MDLNDQSILVRYLIGMLNLLCHKLDSSMFYQIHIKFHLWSMCRIQMTALLSNLTTVQCDLFWNGWKRGFFREVSRNREVSRSRVWEGRRCRIWYESIHLFANWQHHYHAKPEFQIEPTKDPMLYNISLTNDQNKNKKKI